MGEGNGPVNALDHALRSALGHAYPELTKLELIDYRVRIVDAAHGTDAVTRVLVETSDGETSWETVGVHANIIEASWEALLDAVTYGLLRHRGGDVRSEDERRRSATADAAANRSSRRTPHRD